MGFGGVPTNGMALGLGAIVSLFSGYGPDQAQGNLETENGDNLVQEDGGLLLLE